MTIVEEVEENCDEDFDSEYEWTPLAQDEVDEED